MLEVVCLLTAGVLVGRLWAWLKAQTQITECPRCAVEDAKQRTIVEVSAMRRMGEEQMREAATQQPEAPRSYGADEHWPSGRYAGEW